MTKGDYCYKCKRTKELLARLGLKIYSNGYCKECQKEYMLDYKRRQKEKIDAFGNGQTSAGLCMTCSTVTQGLDIPIIGEYNTVVAHVCARCWKVMYQINQLLNHGVPADAIMRCAKVATSHPSLRAGRVPGFQIPVDVESTHRTQPMDVEALKSLLEPP